MTPKTKPKVTKDMLKRFRGKKSQVEAARELLMPYRTYIAREKGLRPIPDSVYLSLQAAKANRNIKK